MEQGNKKWNRELLLHSLLRSLIGFVLLEILMVWLSILHPGGEPDGISMVATGALGILNGVAIYCCAYQDKMVTICRLRIKKKEVAIECASFLLILSIAISIAVGVFAFLSFVCKLELPFVQGCNICLMMVYGYARSHKIDQLKKKINSSFEH